MSGKVGLILAILFAALVGCDERKRESFPWTGDCPMCGKTGTLERITPWTLTYEDDRHYWKVDRDRRSYVVEAERLSSPGEVEVATAPKSE